MLAAYAATAGTLEALFSERVEVPWQFGISIQKVAQQAVNEDGQKIFEVFWQEGEELCIASWARWEAQRKGFVDLERRCQDLGREVQMLNKRQEIFQDAIEGKLSVQDKASERMQDPIIEEIKRFGTQKDRRSLANSGGMTCGCTKMRQKRQQSCSKSIGHHQEI